MAIASSQPLSIASLMRGKRTFRLSNARNGALSSNERGIRNPIDLLREVESLDPQEGARFVSVMRSFRPRLIVNDVRSKDDIRLGFSVRSVCRNYFGLEAEYLGYVNHDPGVRRSVVARRPLVDIQPDCDASVYLQRVAQKLIQGFGTPGAGSEVRR